jgi:outer membrane protein OmpA-like peptidoglycan-associated protein
LVLGGSVPDAATAAGYFGKASSALGPGNVVMEMTLDPRVSGRTLRMDMDEELRFPSGSASFGPEYETLLDLGTALRLLPEATLAVTGHTDAVGDDDMNLALSIARARIVVDWVVERGVPPDRIVARGAGEAEPVADNATPEGRAANRRVEAAVEGITPD